MQLQPDGDLQIARNELVTVTVTAHNTHYLAIFSDLMVADWTIVQPLQQVSPTAVQEARSFVAGGAAHEAFAVSFDFVRNIQGVPNPGAQYVIQVRGNGGPFAVQKRVFPIPPFPINRPFLFEVV